MSIKEILSKYFEYVNGEKFSELSDLFSEDADLYCPVNFRAKGPDEIKTFFVKFPKNYPLHLDTPIDMLIQENKAAVLIQFKGKSASGAPASFQAVDWFTFEGDKIKSLLTFYDSLAFSRSLKKANPA
jgi:hypothetical protein